MSKKSMTEEEISKDRGVRLEACKKEIDAILVKYQFGLIAEDNWGNMTKVRVGLSFVDQKQYESPIAQPSEKVMADLISEDNEPLNKGAEVVDESKITDVEVKEDGK